MEKEGEKEGISKDKEQKKEDERKRKIAAKINFLSKFYPDAHSSPGGNISIVRNINLMKSETDGNSDKGTGETLNRNLALETSLLKRKSENILNYNFVAARRPPALAVLRDLTANRRRKWRDRDLAARKEWRK